MDARPASQPSSQPSKTPERPQNFHYVFNAMKIVISVRLILPILSYRENVSNALLDLLPTLLTTSYVRHAKILTVPPAPLISPNVKPVSLNSLSRTTSVSPVQLDVTSAQAQPPVLSVPLELPSCPLELVRAVRLTVPAAPTSQTAKPVNLIPSSKETTVFNPVEPDKLESVESVPSAQTTVSDAPPPTPVPSASKDSTPTPRLSNAKTAQLDVEFALTTDHANHVPLEPSNPMDPAEKTHGTRNGGPGF